jgi:hypothetical protein
MHLQQILEHGLKPQRKDLAPNKLVTFWTIIETSIDHGTFERCSDESGIRFLQDRRFKYFMMRNKWL